MSDSLKGIKMHYSLLDDISILADIGQNLDKLRISKNLTMAQLAEKSGVSENTIRRIINSKTDPSFSNIIRIYRGLGELDALQNFFTYSEPKDLYRTGAKTRRVRVRTTQPRQATFSRPKWGDEK
jgi:transcriptional regulator with XRE-family HTH domain